MNMLEKKTLLAMHQRLIATYGGSHGLRDEGLLESAIAMPYMTFFGEDLYPSLEAKAAQLCFGLVKNRPFIDGNKRIGAHAMLTLLRMNGYDFDLTNEELEDCIHAVARSEMNASELTAWIKSHIKAE